MRKYDFISALEKETAAEVVKNREEWMKYLTTAARLYKYPFREQLLIYAQRPDATACASIELWNERMHCWVTTTSQSVDAAVKTVEKVISEPLMAETIKPAVEAIPIDFTKLTIEERVTFLPVPTDDIKTEYDAYCDRMGYTTEKLASIRYKMSLYDEFLEEYNYRKKHFGISDASRMVAVSEKSR